jgi:hypothetical protein
MLRLSEVLNATQVNAECDAFRGRSQNRRADDVLALADAIK